ncbi:MAG: prepilin-type N-terminal cleavage/methylation domain-containing protein [Nitrospirae bacterium]|nr:prepilin-type N-terminal cleavage/methylation domain-containing protein [Nitrospirota bacterium]
MRGKKSQERGFTLVELAIVLVIIGIIIGAVMKGQDLLQNARAKKFDNYVKSWEIAEWTYFDRKGRFAGDITNKNGVIGDVAGEQTVTTNAVYEITNANFVNPPASSITMGSYTYYPIIGNGTASSVIRNGILICKAAAACTSTFTSDELVFLESYDTAIDGTADPLAGNVRGITAATITGGAVTAITETAATTWDTTATGFTYYFDKPR